MNFSQCRIKAYIDLKNAEHNYKAIESVTSPGAVIMPAIKADGYGHGALELARLYARLGAYAFCVAGIDEAVCLREGGIEQPILVLGITPPEYAVQLIEYDVMQTVHSKDYALRLCDNLPDGHRLKVHVKLDTGMRRLGFTDPDEAKYVLQLKKLEVCGAFTHFAASDNLQSDFTNCQLERFMTLSAPFKGVMRHTANSAAALCRPETHFDAVRPGIALYGDYPSLEVKTEFEKTGRQLLPVMRLCAGITHVFKVKKGESIGYSRTFYAPDDMTVATISAGYADGVPRALSNRSWVGINGKHCRIVGNVCMDQLMADVSGVEARPGDQAVIFGSGGPSCQSLADLCNTIPYELLCAVSKRVARIYI